LGSFTPGWDPLLRGSTRMLQCRTPSDDPIRRPKLQ
jgi:hypothetical protein